MPTRTDNHDTDGAVSLKWRAHVPAGIVAALLVALNGGTCSKQDETLRRIDDLNTRVSRIEGALGVAPVAERDPGAGGHPTVTVAVGSNR